jgi:hypothetical protein
MKQDTCGALALKFMPDGNVVSQAKQVAVFTVNTCSMLRTFGLGHKVTTGQELRVVKTIAPGTHGGDVLLHLQTKIKNINHEYTSIRKTFGDRKSRL